MPEVNRIKNMFSVDFYNARKLFANNYFIFIIIISIGFLLYSSVLNYGLVYYDDIKYYKELILQSDKSIVLNIEWAFTNVVNANWHPITLMSFVFDMNVYHDAEKGFHLTNLTLHILNAILVFLVFERISQNRKSAFLIALVFLIHPLNVETVAWVGERKGVLSASFFFLSIYSFLCYSEKNDRRLYFLSVMFFIFSLMSKATTVALPLVLILIDLNNYKKLSFKDVMSQFHHKRIFLLVALIFGIITFYVHSTHGALESESTYALNERIMNAINSLWEYLFQFVYPDKLAIYYPTKPHSLVFITVAGIVLIIVSIFTIRKKASLPSIFFGWFWFLLMLLPVIGLVKSGSHAHADRYMYLVVPGLSYLAIEAVFLLRRKTLGFQYLLQITIILLIVSFSLKTYFQVKVWRDIFTLFNHAVYVTHNNFVAHTMLSYAFVHSDDVDNAMIHYDASREIEPRFLITYVSISNALIHKNKPDIAIRVLEDGKLTNIENEFFITRIAEVRIHQKNYSAAKVSLEKLIKNGVEYPNAYYLLGYISFISPDYKKAKYYLKKSINGGDKIFDAVYLLLKIAAIENEIQSGVTWLEILMKDYPEKMLKAGLNNQDFQEANLNIVFKKYQATLSNIK